MSNTPNKRDTPQRYAQRVTTVLALGEVSSPVCPPLYIRVLECRARLIIDGLAGQSVSQAHACIKGHCCALLIRIKPTAVSTAIHMNLLYNILDAQFPNDCIPACSFSILCISTGTHTFSLCVVDLLRAYTTCKFHQRIPSTPCY